MISQHGKAQCGIGWQGWSRGTATDRWTLGYALAIGAVLVCRIPSADLPVVLVVHGLLVALALLMSPLAWEQDTLLLLPAYLFGLLAAWQGSQPREPARNIALIAGSAMLAICIVSGLIKAMPHPGFPLLLAAYFGAALIFRARMRPELLSEAK